MAKNDSYSAPFFLLQQPQDPKKKKGYVAGYAEQR